MAYLARVTYTGNGSTTGYALPFSFIATSHIQAFIDNVQTTAFSISGSTLTFNSAATPELCSAAAKYDSVEFECLLFNMLASCLASSRLNR